MDKKTAAIPVLIVLIVITGAGWYIAWSKPPRVLPLPGGIDNWTQYFPGYEAYLDNDIRGSNVSGGSMEPTFGDNDLILWVEVDNMAELGAGDIIIYKHPTKQYYDNIAHRIIEVGTGYRENQFKTRGDNSPEEYWVPSGNIHGVVIGVIYSAA